MTSGSSPRVRGTRELVGLGVQAHRFIPARAGNAFSLTVGILFHAVHPRACGERASELIYRVSEIGSSPRVRGTPAIRRAKQDGRRFIPARAGNAPVTCSCRSMKSVHPRACGERLLSSNPSSTSIGSSPRARSPRVRGTRLAWHVCGPFRRFIPARAGNAERAAGRPGWRAVHPRACGERGFPSVGIGNSVGSSPRVRGTQLGSSLLWPAPRFIPARAGNAISSRLGRAAASVHPRACGERDETCHWPPPRTGSSPRVRGTQRRRSAIHSVSRFIPARAGNAWAGCGRSATPRFIPARAGNALPVAG